MADNNTPVNPSAPESIESEAPKVENVTPGAIAKVAGAEAQAQTAAESKKIKKLKLKIDGKEAFEDLPFEIDESNKDAIDFLTKQLQMAKMGSKRAGEASEYKKQLDKVGAYLEEMKQNPKKVRELMKDLNVDEKAIAAAILEEELERSKKSPEQLEKEELEEELRSLKEERENEKKTFEQKEFERLQDQAYQSYDNMISSALEKSDLPKSPYVVKKIADYMLLGLQEGLDVSADDVLPLVREEVQADIRQMFSSMPEDVIEQIIGKDTLKRVRKKSIAKASEVPVPVGKSIQDTASKGKPGAPGKKQTFKNYFKM